jgi:NAD(P)-dependent dehydrogenase (short-subunit alcohol dehydrogenase family)
LVSLTESLGVEWAGRGVRVVGIAITPPQSDDQLRRIPLRRRATSEEISEAIVFLASEDASYITAETIQVDGGWVAYQLF